MNRPRIQYCKKETIFPAFGMAYPKEGTAYVRGDLPKSVQRFVECHERYHLRDSAKWWVWREIKASGYAAWRHPIGFGACVVLSLAPHRLAYYIGRIRKGE